MVSFVAGTPGGAFFVVVGDAVFFFVFKVAFAVLPSLISFNLFV
jgi:hypothetical protein